MSNSASRRDSAAAAMTANGANGVTHVYAAVNSALAHSNPNHTALLLVRCFTTDLADSSGISGSSLEDR